MKVLMFGWEFPPYKSGGLGTACYDLTKGLKKKGIEISFVMPVSPQKDAEYVKLIGANDIKGIKVHQVKSTIRAYITEEEYEQEYCQYYDQGKGTKEVYGKNLFMEVARYSKAASKIARTEKHDVIHVHDWMTYEAGINAKKISKKPLVAHIHATEFDRTGGNPNHAISDIEYRGMMAADIVIANSEYTKNNVIRDYKIPPEKIAVVHWGIDEVDVPRCDKPFKEKTVLFLGRITIQKGPDYFIETANKVLKYEPNTKFVIVGDGDMMPRMIARSAELGISNKVVFTGRLSGADVHKAFQSADLYVMPSTSEPFGLVALESLKNGTPVLISKQSGVSEVLKNALKADFWDVDGMTNQIVSVLRHAPLHESLTENGCKEVQQHDIIKPAEKIIEQYKKVIK